MKSINFKGELIDLNEPKVMGILNLTPDSFYDGGKFQSESQILQQVEKMLAEGATFVDIGAYSSRPGAIHVSEEEELKRLTHMVDLILKEFPNARISIDTFRSKVAQYALESGAGMINDISGGNMDQKMYEIIARYQVPYIIMHMKGTPQNMQQKVQYVDLMKEMIQYFSDKIYDLRKLGVSDILIDPGFGFSKTLDQNYQVLQHLDLLRFMELPILVGLSRKSMLYKMLDIGPQDALNATTAANCLALQNGANILRVHDVKEAVQAIAVFLKTIGY